MEVNPFERGPRPAAGWGSATVTPQKLRRTTSFTPRSQPAAQPQARAQGTFTPRPRVASDSPFGTPQPQRPFVPSQQQQQQHRPPHQPQYFVDPANIFSRAHQPAPPHGPPRQHYGQPVPLQVARSRSLSSFSATLPRGGGAALAAYAAPAAQFAQAPEVLVIQLPPEYADGLPPAPPAQSPRETGRRSLASVPDLFVPPDAELDAAEGTEAQAASAAAAAAVAASPVTELERQVRALSHLPAGAQIGVLCRELALCRERLRTRETELLRWQSLLRGDGSPYTLMEACVEGRAPLVQLFIEHGAAPDHPDEQGRTGLMAAAQGGHEAVVRVLLEAGVDSNSLGRGGGDAGDDGDGPRITPLMCACFSGHLPTVRVLLEHGADVNAVSAGGLTALGAAAGAGHAAVLPVLLEAGAVRDFFARMQGSPGTALATAVRHNQAEAASALLEAGAKPLHELLEPPPSAGPRRRSASSVDPGPPPADGELSLACATGNEELVALLLGAGWPVNARQPDGRTALHQCAGGNANRLVRALLDRGAEVDAVDARGHTPLMEACETGSVESVYELLMSGADPCARAAAGGESPLNLAVSNPENDGATVQLVIQFGGNPMEMSVDHPSVPVLAMATEEQREGARAGVEYRRQLSTWLAAATGLPVASLPLKLIRQYIPGAPLPSHVDVPSAAALSSDGGDDATEAAE